MTLLKRPTLQITAGILSLGTCTFLLLARTAIARKTTTTTTKAADDDHESMWWPMSLLSLLSSPETADELFNACLVALGATILAMRSYNNNNNNSAKKKTASSGGDDTDNKENTANDDKPKSERAKSLQRRFLPVFWLLRLSFWMSGPYFYQVYASKEFDGEPPSPTLLSHIFLVGFGSIAVFGPSLGRALDVYGRKRGTLGACLAYSLGALSTRSSSLPVLLLGRAAGGLGSNLLSSAPEAWLVSEALGAGGKDDESDSEDMAACLSETFGTAYSYDPVVAILSGQIAGRIARRDGPTGPFALLPAFLIAGCAIVLASWEENTASSSSGGGDDDDDNKKEKGKGTRRPSMIETITKSPVTVRDGLREIRNDKKLLMLGAVQSLFEGSMCIFVSQWPPAVASAVVRRFGEDANVPYGTVFSCFMACCMVGSTIYTRAYSDGLYLERHLTKMMLVAALSVAGTTYSVATEYDAGLVLGMFAFEACVGMYFPMIGTMRSKYLPGSHRSIIMSIYAMPLNMLVVTVFLFIERLGTTGAFVVATLALAVAVLCTVEFRRIRSREAVRNIKMIRDNVREKILNMSKFKAVVEERRLSGGKKKVALRRSTESFMFHNKHNHQHRYGF